MADEAEEKMRKAADFRTLLLASVVSALTFVTGLCWNDAIKSAIEKIVPTADSTFYKFVAAIIVTVIAAALVYLLLHSQKLAEERMLKRMADKPAKNKSPENKR